MLISEFLVRYSSKKTDNETGGFNIGLFLPDIWAPETGSGLIPSSVLRFLRLCSTWVCLWGGGWKENSAWCLSYLVVPVSAHGFASPWLASVIWLSGLLFLKWANRRYSARNLSPKGQNSLFTIKVESNHMQDDILSSTLPQALLFFPFYSFILRICSILSGFEPY